jgi:hypothetical protein
MNSRHWTQAEIERMLELYEGGLGCGDISEELTRTESAVRYKLYGMGLSSRRIEPQAGSEEDGLGVNLPLPDSQDGENFLRSDEYNVRAQRELDSSEVRKRDRQKVEEAKREILEERIVAEFRMQLTDALPTRIVAPPRSPRPATGPAATAVLVISDMHAGQVVDSREIEHLGAYNPAITVARLAHLESEVARILDGRNIDKLLLLLAGDIVHGHLGHSLEDDLTVPIVQQVDLAYRILFQFVARLSEDVPAIEIHGVAGNHGRWPGMRKMPSDRRWSNLDTIVYGAVAALCEQSRLANVTFEERFSSRRTIPVGAFTLQLIHGDEVRGGNFCVSGMNREVTNATLRNVQSGRAAPDIYVMGDKHFSASLPFGSGAFVVNGSFVGADSFGMNFIPSPPSQTLFFLEPRLGKTESHQIPLQNAKWPAVLPYELKPSLEELVMRHAPRTNS